MQRPNEQRIGRRSVLKGAGVTLGALGGLASPVSAGRGRVSLNDRSADMMLYWSIGSDPDGKGPYSPEDFGYPGPFSPGFPGGLYLPTHDPSPGGLFDFSRIEMTPNGGTLHNIWTFFHGALMESKAKPYPLVHQGDGVYESRGQVMKFEAQESDEQVGQEPDIDMLRYPMDFPVEILRGKLFPPVEILEGGTWRAVGKEKALLGVESGDVTPNPEIAATRVDIYTAGKPVYVLSLLYLIWQSDSPSTDPIPGLPTEEGTVPPEPGDVHSLALDLITAGRLNPGGQ